MGTLERGTTCPTDGLGYLQTPGYFGHIDLAKPVFYVHFMDTILGILKIICFKCRKLLIDKAKFESWRSLPNDVRWKRVYTVAAKVKRCGEHNDDGCGCKVPKIKKDGFATILAEWTNDDGNKTMKVTPEVVIKIFSGISNEDVSFMGLDPIYSRPEWMVCQVFAVPPPAVRPSVKHDAQQRSEDDLSHILIQIVKINQSLLEKMENPATAPHVIEEEHNILQYFVAIMVDNQITGAQPAAQRSSGRVLKALKNRLSGKTGRMRFNLMGKRVNYSARTVITPDPYISVQELGVPKKIALNMTKPVTVNSRNYDFLRKLVQNGPDVHPGAKIVEKGGAQIFLRYADRMAISQSLDYGDVVHRHMLDGDFILFNRQPTLHRGSMMGHCVRIMPKGDTFRLNVADTKPYNADFDGDEMNLHMPQDSKSEIELCRLAAVPYQIVCPTTNQTIINIFQDNLLGAYLFTRGGIKFTPSQAMALCVNIRAITDYSLFSKPEVTFEDLMTLIMPPITVTCKGVKIVAGKYIKGQVDKKVLGARSNSIIHRIFNDYGGIAAADFIDHFQHIVTEYMKVCGYSVGVSDLIATTETTMKINSFIQEKKRDVDALITEALKGTFVNETGLTNAEVLEDKINEILASANETAGKTGLNSLAPTNRFVQMVNAGSKGSSINIAQMISCLGQQQIDGQRIPYGLQHRTLPHFSKFDDSMKARGFIESSFIGGLQPYELFFHAQGGRMGLIDTALRTSETGYIQRKMVKGLEDLKACYDGTVRNSLDQIVQFKYGDDNIDPCKIEEQPFDLCWMSVEDVYDHYSTIGIEYDSTTNVAQKAQSEGPDTVQESKKWIEIMLAARTNIARAVFNFQNESIIRLPVGFTYTIENVKNRFELQEAKVDLTPLEAYRMLDHYYNAICGIGENYQPSELFRVAYYFYLSPAQLLKKHKYTRAAVTFLLESILLQYKKALVAPGEMVGIIAAQSIGEPTTQLTLNTFHYAGVASESMVTHGTPRVDEILSISPNVKKPSMTIYPLIPTKEEANKLKSYIEQTKLADVVSAIELYVDDAADGVDEGVTEYHRQFEEMVAQSGVVRAKTVLSKWIFRMELDAEKMYNKGMTMNDVHFALKYTYGDNLGIVYSDYNSESLVFRIQLSNDIAKKKLKKALDDTDYISKIRQFEDDILNLTLRGIEGIEQAVVRQIKNKVVFDGTKFQRQDIYVLDTVGSNLLTVLGLPFVDVSRTTTNDIREVHKVLGIEAARKSIYDEITKVIEVDTYINNRHKTVLGDRMAFSAFMVSISRTGVNRDRGNPIGKASFEETTDMFIQAAKTGEIDLVRGPSANVMLGQHGFYGTSSFDVILDLEQLKDVKLQRKRYMHLSDAVKTNLDDLASLDIKNDLSQILAGAQPAPVDSADYSIDL
jgi:DNA-directed RNA polymerase II subunit RPB1